MNTESVLLVQSHVTASGLPSRFRSKADTCRE
jgi:hypothetical protein